MKILKLFLIPALLVNAQEVKAADKENSFWKTTFTMFALFGGTTMAVNGTWNLKKANEGLTRFNRKLLNFNKLTLKKRTSRLSTALFEGLEFNEQKKKKAIGLITLGSLTALTGLYFYHKQTK